MPTENIRSQDSSIPAGAAYLPWLLANAEGITDNAVRKPIGRVVTNLTIPVGYDLQDRIEEVKHGLTSKGLRNILKDRPAWEGSDKPMYPKSQYADMIEDMHKKMYREREPVWRAMWGLPARPGIDAKALHKIAPNKFTLADQPDFYNLVNHDSHSIMGGYSTADANGKTVKYRDFWNIAPNTHDMRAYFENNPQATHKDLKRIKATNIIRRLIDIVSKTPTIEGEASFEGASADLLKKIPKNLPTYNSDAAWYKKDIGELVKEKLSKSVAKTRPENQKAIAKLLAKAKPGAGLLGKAIKSPLGLLPGLLLEAKRMAGQGSTLSEGLANTLDASNKVNAGPSNWEAFKQNISNPATALMTGGKSIYDRIRNMF